MPLGPKKPGVVVQTHFSNTREMSTRRFQGPGGVAGHSIPSVSLGLRRTFLKNKTEM